MWYQLSPFPSSNAAIAMQHHPGNIHQSICGTARRSQKWDRESVFLLFFYWAVHAVPKMGPPGGPIFWIVLVAQLVSRQSCVADRLPVVVRFPASPRLRLKTVDPPKGNGLGQKKNRRSHFLEPCLGSFFEVCCIKVAEAQRFGFNEAPQRPEGQLGRPFWAKPVLRMFSGPRIGSVGGSCFVHDFVSCWGKQGAYRLLLEPSWR